MEILPLNVVIDRLVTFFGSKRMSFGFIFVACWIKT